MKVAGGAAGPPTDPFPCWGHTPTFPVVGPLGWHRRCDAAASSPGLPSSGVSTAGMCHLSPPVFSQKEMCTWWGGLVVFSAAALGTAAPAASSREQSCPFK